MREIEVQYRNNLTSNYIVMKNPNVKVNDYRLNMLLKNDLEGFLKFCISCVDGEIEFSYLISSKQSLMDLLGRQKLGYEEMINIMKGIVNIAERAHRYLLKIDDVLLEPELIYLDYNCRELWFCYYPNSGNNFNEAVKNLVQRLILITEHGDSNAVRLIYGIYEICERADFLIGDIELFMNNHNKNNFYGEAGSIKDYRQKDENEQCDFNMVCEDAGIMENMNEGIFKNEIKTIIKENGIIKKISKLFRIPDISKSKKNQKNVDCFDDIYKGSEFGGNSVKTHKIKAEHGIREYEETMLLSDVTLDSKRTLLSVDGQNRIEINNFPFIIGKLSERVDYVLDNKSVSRIHLKIDIDEKNKFLVEDLNSKNGTYINEIRLKPYEKRYIEIGDKITIAASDYIFR